MFLYFLAFSSIFCLAYSTPDAPNQTNIRAYNAQFDDVLSKNPESIKNFAKIFAKLGGDVTEAITAGIETAVEELKPDWAAAFKLAFNHSMQKLNTLQNIIVEMCSDIRIALVDVQLKELSVKSSHFSRLYQRSEKYHNKTAGAEALRDACKRYDPQLNLD